MRTPTGKKTWIQPRTGLPLTAVFEEHLSWVMELLGRRGTEARISADVASSLIGWVKVMQNSVKVEASSSIG